MTPAKSIAILQSNYIPWKGYFDIINSVDEFVIYDDVQYTKNDWRNRNILFSPQGRQWLTIPIRHKSGQLILEAESNDPLWQQKHWAKITNAYRKAPFFKEYKGFFEEFYLGPQVLSLTQANHELITIVCKLLNISTRIIRSEGFTKFSDPTERLVHIATKLDATTYLTGPAGLDYLKLEKFAEKNISVEVKSYEGYSEYVQFSQPFQHDVSILDMFFHVGPESEKYFQL